MTSTGIEQQDKAREAAYNPATFERLFLLRQHNHQADTYSFDQLSQHLTFQST